MTFYLSSKEIDDETVELLHRIGISLQREGYLAHAVAEGDMEKIKCALYLITSLLRNTGTCFDLPDSLLALQDDELTVRVRKWEKLDRLKDIIQKR